MVICDQDGRGQYRRVVSGKLAVIKRIEEPTGWFQSVCLDLVGRALSPVFRNSCLKLESVPILSLSSWTTTQFWVDHALICFITVRWKFQDKRLKWVSLFLRFLSLVKFRAYQYSGIYIIFYPQTEGENWKGPEPQGWLCSLVDWKGDRQ